MKMTISKLHKYSQDNQIYSHYFWRLYENDGVSWDHFNNFYKIKKNNCRVFNWKLCMNDIRTSEKGYNLNLILFNGKYLVAHHIRFIDNGDIPKLTRFLKDQWKNMERDWKPFSEED